MLDSGATNNFISQKLAHKLGLSIQQNTQFDKVQLADGNKLSVSGQTSVQAQFSTFTCRLEFIVLNADIPNIFGLPFFHQINPSIDWQKNTLRVKFGKQRNTCEYLLQFHKNDVNGTQLQRSPPKTHRVAPRTNTSNSFDGLDITETTVPYAQQNIAVPYKSPPKSPRPKRPKLHKPRTEPSKPSHNSTPSTNTIEQVTLRTFVSGHKKKQYQWANLILLDKEAPSLNFTHRASFGTEGTGDTHGSYNQLASDTMSELKSDFAEVFSTPSYPIDRSDTPWQIHHDIQLKDPNADPPKRKIYPLDQQELEELRNQIETLLSDGRITTSNSPYGAPILFARKKNGKLRMCIDYRQLNSQTIMDSYPLPRIDQLTSQLNGAKIFSKIDLSNAYHQIPMETSARSKTAFTCRYGTFEFLVMPFGLCNAPSTFQRAMNTIFFPLLDKGVLIYLDDILIYSKTIAEHKKLLREVFALLQKHKFYVEAEKCALFLEQVEFLGHTINDQGIHVNQGKIDAIKTWPTPQNVTQVQSFLGLCNYYRKFIIRFSQLAQPLIHLTKANVKFLWTALQEQSFQNLKSALTSAPVLKIYDESLPIRIICDASDYCLGAILEQQYDNQWYPVEFYSKKLTAAELNYSATEKEFLAIKQSLERWRHYLIGSKFVVLSDHASLQYLTSQQNLSRRQARWLNFYQEFDFTIQHIPGKDNVADYLSRIPNQSTSQPIQSLLDDQSTFSTIVQLCKKYNVNPDNALAALHASLSACVPLHYIECKHCKACHLDEHDFAIKSHQKHICHSCNRTFKGLNGAANPLALLQPRLSNNKIVFNTIAINSILSELAPPTCTQLSSVITIFDKPVLKQHLRKAQDDSKDPTFKKLFNEASDSSINLQVRNGILCKCIKDSWCPVVPNDAYNLKSVIMQDLHTSALGGHQGYHKLLKMISARFYWPKMADDIKQFIQDCAVCQRTKVDTSKPSGLLQPLENPDTPFTMVSMDFIGPLPMTKNGHDAIFTVVDRYSRFVIFIPTTYTCSAQEVANLFLDNVVTKYGMPSKIISDRDPKFTSNFWQQLISSLNCRVALSSSYHPQTDGLTERYHRTIEQVLRSYINQMGREESSWDTYLQQAAFSVNNTYQASVGYSPCEILLGYKPQLPLDLAFEKLTNNKLQSIDDIIRNRQAIHMQVKKNLEKSVQQMVKQTNKKRKPLNLQPGDYAYLRSSALQLPSHQNRKLAPRYLGPFKVEKQHSSSYRLSLPPHIKVHPVFHSSLLKPCSNPEDIDSAPTFYNDGQPEYEVQQLLRHRFNRRRNGRLEYLVRWKNCDPSEDSWEPIENLENASQIVKDYNQKNKLV